MWPPQRSMWGLLGNSHQAKVTDLLKKLLSFYYISQFTVAALFKCYLSINLLETYSSSGYSWGMARIEAYGFSRAQMKTHGSLDPVKINFKFLSVATSVVMAATSTSLPLEKIRLIDK